MPDHAPLLSFMQQDINNIAHLSQATRILLVTSYDPAFQYENIIKVAAECISDYHVISLQSDPSLKECSLFPFKLYFSSFIEEQRGYSTKQIMADIVRDFTQSDTLGNLARKIKLGISYEESCFISQESNDILIAIEKASKTSQPLFILSCISDFDNESKSLIKLILSGELDRYYPALLNAKFIFTDVSFDADIYNSIRLLDHRSYVLQQLTIDEMPHFIDAMLSTPISQSDSNLIYKLCGGQISKISILCRYLSRNTGHKINYKDSGFRDILFSVIKKRLEQMGIKSQTITSILGVAAEIAEVLGDFNLRELKCVLQNHPESIIDKAIYDSDSEYFTKTRAEISRFTHKTILEFFLRENAGNRVDSNLKIEQAIKYFRPGDFLFRAQHLEKAGKLDDAKVLYLLQYIKNRLAYHVPSDLLLKKLKFKKNDAFSRMFNTFKDFFDAYENLGYKTSYDILESDISIIHPKLIIAKYYLLSLNMKKLGAKLEVKQESIVLMQKVIESAKEEEPYLWETATSSMISLYINYYGDQLESKNLYRQLIYSFSKRLEYDPDARQELHILYRKANAVFSPETAVKYTQESVHFFENTISFSNYLMSLNNHGANLLVIGKYNDSLSVLVKAITLLNEHPVQRVSLYILNNYLIAMVMSNAKVSDTFVRMFELLIEQIDDCDTKVIPLITLANITALSGDLVSAEALLVNASNICNVLNDDYFDYYINTNLASLKFLACKFDEALKLYETTCYQPPSLAANTYRHLYDQRFSEMKSLFESKVQLSINEFSHCILISFAATPQGDFFSRGFLFSDIQFWSES